ncbi:hypothetical protein Hamer_G021306 [Homarus americanus]|uniref:Uncharacterized protein n=1 Tax=Homarus americanus TaxID=6706 RepID=A0A8J5JTD3_HOMAM|nr:hypothetical protein Hamer_G021306 [Homarus americanus]
MSRRVTKREDVAQAIGLYKTNHKVTEIVELTGVCRRTCKNLADSVPQRLKEVLGNTTKY